MEPNTTSFWTTARHRSRPVSRWRRRFGLAALLLVMLGCLGWYRLTDEARLRGYAQQWLRDFTGGEAHIQEVRFDVFRGLDLIGVTLALPASERFDPLDDSLTARTVFRSSSVFLRLRPLSIISGDLAVPEIVAVNPELTLTTRLSDGSRNWEAMLARRLDQPSGGPLQLPAIRVRNVRVRQFALDDRGRLAGAVQTFWADAIPPDNLPGVYEIFVSKVESAPEGDEVASDRGRLRIDLNTLAVSGSNLPTLSVGDVRYALPPEVQKWVTVLALGGYVRPDTLTYDPRTGGAATLTLRAATLSLPANDADNALPPEDRYLRFTDVGGTLSFQGRRAELDLRGRFHDSAFTLAGELLMPPGEAMSADLLGFDLKLDTKELRLPRMDRDTPESQARFVRQHFRLEEFVSDYDGRGFADIALALHRPAGADQALVVEGEVRVSRTSGRFHLFPYPLENISCVIQIRRDGSFELRDLVGEHGAGRVYLTAEAVGFTSYGVDVDIRGENIVLDEDLIACLSPEDQALCRSFNLSAAINLHVTMKRPHAPRDGPAQPWTNVVEIDFLDGALSFDGFPYPLSDLRGAMRVAGGGFELMKLRGRHGSLTAEASGTMRREGDDAGAMDLTITGTNMPLDDTLAAALPEQARRRYQQWEPAGSADLQGRLRKRAGQDDIDYQLDVALRDASLRVPDTPVRVTEVRASLGFSPGEMNLRELSGRLGGSELRCSGSFDPIAGELRSLHVRSDRLQLDKPLYEVLPAAIRAVWDRFAPSGAVAVDLDIRPTSTTQPASPTDAVTTQPAPDFAAVIEPLDCAATFEGFPLPVTDLRGRIEATGTAATLRGLSMSHGDGRITLDGIVDYHGPHTVALLTLHAAGMSFTEELRKAMPWRARRLWNDARPGGRFDLNLKKMVVTSADGGPSVIEFEGAAELTEASLSVGAELTGVTGRLTGSGRAGDTFSMEADLGLDKASVDGREVRRVSARLSRPADENVFRVGAIQAAFCGGMILGDTEIRYDQTLPRFNVNLTGQDISLQEFLNAKREPDEPPVSLKGSVAGTLRLGGRIGDSRGRRGGGDIVIRNAEIVKVPLMLAMFQVVHLAGMDDNAFHDGTMAFAVDNDDLIITQIDLRGNGFSMVGAGRFAIPDEKLDLTFLIGSPLKLPRIEVLSEFLEGVARELVEVHVEGTLEEPTYRADIVRSVSKALDALLNARMDRR